MASIFGKPEQATPAQNSNYRQGICIDCGKQPHSAGRPRCDSCHRTYSGRI